MSRWKWSFDAINPCHPQEAKWKTGVDERYYKQLQNSGHEKAIARLLLVERVLNGGTERIYKSWCRPEKEDCFVYVRYPDVDFKSLTISTPPPPNMAFLVFVLPDGTITEWTWRPLSEAERDTPEGVTGELVWPPNKT